MGRAFISGVGNVVRSLTDPYGFVSATNNAFKATQPTSVWNNTNIQPTQTQSILGTQPAIGPLSFQNFTTTPGGDPNFATTGYVDPGTQGGWGNFGGSYTEGLDYGDDVDIDTGYGTGLWT